MNIKYTEKMFINPGIEYGIQSYLSNKVGKGFKRIHVFEMNVIKALTIIYGEKSILLPYKIDNTKAFECNLLIYDLREQDMKNFVKYMNDYYEFMKSFNSESKASGLISEIENILMEMINKRNKRKPFTNEEIKEFDTIFNPLEGDLKNIKNLLSSNQGLIVREWQTNRYELTNTQTKMIAVNPNLLTREEYNKYGYDIRIIASLDEETIEKINSKIFEEKNNIYKPITSKILKTNRFKLSRGSGFVNKLLVLSIISTFILGAIIVFKTLGG